jgi:hypothetical protein
MALWHVTHRATGASALRQVGGVSATSQSSCAYGPPRFPAAFAWPPGGQGRAPHAKGRRALAVGLRVAAAHARAPALPAGRVCARARACVLGGWGDLAVRARGPRAPLGAGRHPSDLEAH